VLTTVARTATLMLMVELIVFIILKPKVMFRLWPFALPFLVVVHVAVPGTLGSLKSSFFPSGGLIAEQQSGAGTYGSNRLADLGPALKEWKKTPHFGQGFGTRITQRSDPKWNSPILDDQWLGWLLETGWLGFVALLWLFFRSVRRLGRAARKDDSDHGWLLASLAASITAMGIGMITFDAFGFIQVAILLFIVFGVGAAAVRLAKPEAAAPRRGDPRLAA
jgi:O-antigen ligase/polysaccharide polymerase Wzy-like membrane protein